MTIAVAAIWRYPVKGIGRESVERVTLAPGGPLPGDRAFAVLQQGAPDTDDWQPRRNFLQVASGPDLAAVTVTRDAQDALTFRHADGTVTAPLSLPRDGAALIAFAAPHWPEARPAPARIVVAPPETGMPDNGAATLSVLNLASLAALSDRLGQPLQIERFRGNVILAGARPWEEFDWIGRDLTIGDLTLSVTERIERCRATEANTETGRRDANVPAALRDAWGHQDFGVYATVRTGGTIVTGAAVTLA